MTYAGLTTADKGALLDAKANGFKVLCETSNGGRVFYSKYPSASEANSRIISIDLALAQIAEMEKAQKPMTVGDKVVELWATDKRAFAARFVITRNTYGFKTYYALHGQLNRTKHGEIEHDNVEDAIQDELDFLNSPYTEGETK